MNKQGAIRKSMSALLTLAIIGMVVALSPVSALDLSMQAPRSAPAGSLVGFNVKLDLRPGETLYPVQVTVEAAGVSCTFDAYGNQVSGDCSSFEITPIIVGKGGFGYGYGFGSQAANEFFWRVHWDTSGVAPGEYTIKSSVGGESSQTPITLRRTGR
jgi:hypothetical protein